MNVLLIKDVSNLGFAGDVIRVSEGHARNFLFPQKLAKVATDQEVEKFRSLLKSRDSDIAAMSGRVAMLAGKIKNLRLTIKHSANDKGKLYGAIGEEEIVELLAANSITVNKKQIEFDESIRTVGEFEVTVRLTSKAKVKFTLKVVAES